MFYYYDPTYILILIGAIVALYAQIKVSTTYAKWQKVPSATRMTGAQIARQILDNNGCQDVRIEAINGKLTDHYDPENGVLRLSSEVYSSGLHAALAWPRTRRVTPFRTRRITRRCASARRWCRLPTSARARRFRCSCSA